MGTKVAVCCTLLYILLDVILTTVLYTSGLHLITFKEDVLDFNILQSMLDVWGTTLLRASLLLGASIGVLWNKDDGPSRVSKLTTFILVVCMLIIIYALAKMLMLTELDSLIHQPWQLSLICWTCASSPGVVLLWRQLGKEANSVTSCDSRSSGGVGSEDTEKLVETAGEEEQEVGCESRKKSTSSGATIGRLIRCCKKDAELLSIATLFLLIAAVCECP